MHTFLEGVHSQHESFHLPYLYSQTKWNKWYQSNDITSVLYVYLCIIYLQFLWFNSFERQTFQKMATVLMFFCMVPFFLTQIMNVS